MRAGPQADPGTSQDSPLGPLLDWLEDPQVLELVFLGLFGLVLLWVLLSLRASLGRLRERKRLEAYLEGIEAGLSGDPQAARDLLGPVVEADPGNLGARLALGDALYVLERPSEAHRHHMEARQVFEAQGARINLALARDLRAAGKLGKAIEEIDLALQAKPRDETLLSEAWIFKEEGGLYEEALAAGRTLFARKGGEALRRRLSGTAAMAGFERRRRGDRQEALRYFEESLSLDPGNLQAKKGRLLHRCEKLWEEGSRALPLAGGGGGELALLTEEEGRGELLDLFPESVCPDCGTPRPAGESPCRSCGALSPAAYPEKGFAEGISDPTALSDEIEENEDWFLRLAERVRGGDPQAAEEIQETPERGLQALLSVFFDQGDLDGEGGVQTLLVRMGSRDPGALLQARALLRSRRPNLLPGWAGGRDLDEVLGPVFRRLSREALPAFRSLLDRGQGLGDPGLRELVLDFYLGLADLEAFEELAARYSPVEIVRHLNKVPCQELVPLFSRLPEGGSYLREAILLDPNLDRDRALVRAAIEAPKDALSCFRELFRSRGPGRGLLTELVHLLSEGGEGLSRAEWLLGSFLPDAIQYLVAGFEDPHMPAPAHEAIDRLLVDAGPAMVSQIVRVFGSAPSAVDDRTVSLLSSLGAEAVAPLVAAYRQQISFLGRLQNVFFMRGRHPRACLIRALEANSSKAAREALEALGREEGDPELQSLLRETLRRSREAGS